jgi:MFS family permease
LLRSLRDKFAIVGGAAPRVYWYVWWGTLVNRLGSFVVPLLTIYLTQDRELAVDEAGGIVAVFGLGQVLASIAGGQMADRIGRRPTLLVSLFGGAAAMLVLGFVRDLTAITIMVGVVGFVGDQYRPAVAAIVADVIETEQRIQAYGLLHWVINVGFACAAVIGGVVADVDFTILFVADAATMAIYGVIVFFAVPETRPARVSRDRVAEPSRSWITDPQFVAFLWIMFALTLLPVQSGAALSAHMTAQDFTSAGYGVVMAVNGIIIIVFQPALTAVAARFDPSRVLALGAVCYGIGIALHGAATHLVHHAAAVLIWTLGEILESPTRSTVVAALAPADARGRYQGAVTMTWGAAMYAGPKLGTIVWQDLGANALWLGCLGLGLVCAIAQLAWAPAYRRRVAATSPSRSESS